MVYVHIKHGKLESRALRGMFVSYPEGVKGYKIWCIDFKPSKCFRSKEITFHEADMINDASNHDKKNYKENDTLKNVEF